MANAIVTVHGGPSSIATILGQSPARVPTAGKIRAGIKVLTRAASEQPLKFQTECNTTLATPAWQHASP